ncbi:MAG: hypothetical protein MZU84_05845 [Sphingobacterium sp.]|nr:hypothetical protein [Sphingobacterium sp.]
MDRGEGQQLEPRARQPLQRAAARSSIDPDAGRRPSGIVLDQVIPPIPPPKDTKYIKPRAHPERPPDEVLGPADVPRRLRAAAGGLRRAPRGPLSAGHQPRALPLHVRRLPRDAARPGPQARLQRALPARRATTAIRAGVRPRSSTRTGPGRASRGSSIIEIQHANPYYDDSYAVNSANLGPYGDAIVQRAHPLHREEVPGPRPGLGAVPLRRLDRRLGGPGRPGLLPRRVQRLLTPPAPTRSTSAPTRPVNIYEHRERLLSSTARGRRRRGPATATTSARSARPSSEMNHRELALGTHGRSGGQWDIWQAVYSARRPGRLPEADLGQAAPARSTATSPPTGRSTTTSTHILQRDWKTLGPKLRGQDPHLRRATWTTTTSTTPSTWWRRSSRARRTRTTPARSTTATGPSTAGTATTTRPNAISRLRYHQMYIPRIVEADGGHGARRARTSRAGGIEGRRPYARLLLLVLGLALAGPGCLGRLSRGALGPGRGRSRRGCRTKLVLASAHDDDLVGVQAVVLGHEPQVDQIDDLPVGQDERLPIAAAAVLPIVAVGVAVRRPDLLHAARSGRRSPATGPGARRRRARTSCPARDRRRPGGPTWARAARKIDDGQLLVEETVAGPEIDDDTRGHAVVVADGDVEAPEPSVGDGDAEVDLGGEDRAHAQGGRRQTARTMAFFMRHTSRDSNRLVGDGMPFAASSGVEVGRLHGRSRRDRSMRAQAGAKSSGRTMRILQITNILVDKLTN